MQYMANNWIFKKFEYLKNQSKFIQGSLAIENLLGILKILKKKINMLNVFNMLIFCKSKCVDVMC